MTHHSPMDLAQQVQVDTADGARMPGWVVASDVVVVQAGGLKAPISVTVDGATLTAEATHETTLGVDDEKPWTALELPDGTIEVAGERRPPTLPESLGTDRPLGARRAFWCLVFPLMRGCR